MVPDADAISIRFRSSSMASDLPTTCTKSNSDRHNPRRRGPQRDWTPEIGSNRMTRRRWRIARNAGRSTTDRIAQRSWQNSNQKTQGRKFARHPSRSSLLGTAYVVRRLVGPLLLVALIGCSNQNTTSNADATSSSEEPQTQSSAPPAPPRPTASDESETSQKIDKIGVIVVESWWFAETETTYEDLADKLENDRHITNKLAGNWRSQGTTLVVNISEKVQISSMEIVRLEEDNATFEVVYEQRTNLGEPQKTFLEFIDDNGTWKVDQIR